MYLVPRSIDWFTLRRLTAILLLVTSVLMIFPIALPVAMRETESAVEGKDLSEPFPCQSRSCGCRSAKQCWKKCCCFTNAQKLAWAKAHRVQAPAYVAEAARREATPPAVADGQVSSRQNDRCCSTAGVCHNDSSSARSNSKPHRTVTSGDKFVVMIQALQCQGVEQTLLGQLISIQPPTPMDIEIPVLDRGEPAPLQSGLPLIPCDQEPPTPPPRLTA